MRKGKPQIVGSLADSVLKFSTEIDILIKHPKIWTFLHCLKDTPGQCFPEKVNLMEDFCS